MNEEWRPVSECPDYYEVSDQGRVRSLRTMGLRRVVMQNSGYLMVPLYVRGEQLGRLVHRLVASAFVPNPDELPQVNHLDENKVNNQYSNLQWVTASENLLHGTRGYRYGQTRGSEYAFISPDGILHEGVNLRLFCREHNLRQADMWKVLNGKVKSCM